jgi:hypothetical protein
VYAEKRNAYQKVSEPEGNRQLGRPRNRLKNNIKIDLTEIEWSGIEWINLAEDRDQWRAFLNTVMNSRVL